MLAKGELKYGDIVWAEFDPSIGHEFQNKRPAVVIQGNNQIKVSNLVTVMPLTGNSANKLPDDIVICADAKNNLKKDSVIKVFNIVSCDYGRFDGVIGVAGDEVMQKIKKYLKIHFELK